jgi:sporulation protein YlmC with PRC-barrel domain
VHQLAGGGDGARRAALHFGRPVEGSDGRLGLLTDVVVERNERRLTHLVVEDPAGKARLVPAELFVQERESDGSVVLSCSITDLAACDSIRSFSYIGFGPEGLNKSDGTDVGVEDVVPMPAFGALAFSDYAGDLGGAYGVTYDSIPTGSAELRRESVVVSETQDLIGNVHGLQLEGTRLTHVLLHRPHRAEPETIPIPVASVVSIDTDCVTVANWADESG